MDELLKDIKHCDITMSWDFDTRLWEVRVGSEVRCEDHLLTTAVKIAVSQRTTLDRVFKLEKRLEALEKKAK